jgi:hypothetical protein
MDTQLANPLPHWLRIPGMTEAKTVQARCDQAAYTLILELHSPFTKSLGLFYLGHSLL